VTGWPQVLLGTLCQVSRATISPEDQKYEGLSSVGLEQVESTTGIISLAAGSRTSEGRSVNFRFDERHILYGRLRPYLNKVALPDFAGRCSTELVPLLPAPGVDRGFLAALLRQPGAVQAVMAANTGSRMPRADMNVLLALPVPRPPIVEQRRIVDILDRAASIRRLRRQAQGTARQIVPALFHKLFGDPINNPMGWPVAPLETVANVASGVTKGRRLDGAEVVDVPYMRVANVQDGFLDLGEVKTIPLRPSEIDRFRLLPGDMLMTEGGDADKLGRGAIWKGQIPYCAHRNHVFRVRADRTRILPHFLACLSGSTYGKSYFLRVSKRTTGIASINKTQLSAFPVVLPPVALQEEFEQRVDEVTRLAERQRTADAACEAAAQAVQARIFG
jgi:type I restriction enzyme S subunit